MAGELEETQGVPGDVLERLLAHVEKDLARTMAPQAGANGSERSGWVPPRRATGCRTPVW